MLTVACVLSGGSYNKSHVTRLRQQLIGRINQPFEFVCIEDSSYPGWWAKIDLFKPGRFKGRVLYFDLDVEIVDNLDDLINFPWPFCIIKDWLGGVNSSVMVWDAGFLDHIYEKFTPEVMDRLHGDQDFIREQMLSSAKFPKNWCISYKYHVIQNKVPEGVKVIVYHGSPKPWELL